MSEDLEALRKQFNAVVDAADKFDAEVTQVMASDKNGKPLSMCVVARGESAAFLQAVIARASDELGIIHSELDQCVVCGCTEDAPCPGGCAWIIPGLCSACYERAKPRVFHP